MRNAMVAWYAYSESGAEARRANRWVELTSGDDVFGAADPFGAADGYPAVDRLAEADAFADPVDLDDPTDVVGLFADVRRLDAHVDARGWQGLFSRYGLDGLIDLAKRRGGWPEPTADEAVAEAIVGQSLDAGYDPVSGLTGAIGAATGRFEPSDVRGGRRPGIRDAREIELSRN